MSTEQIVNRVSQTPHFEAEGAKLSKVGPAPVFEESEDLDRMNSEGPQIARITHIDEAIEAPDDNIGNVASASNVGTANVLLSSQINSLDVEFKRQVIAAFRHLGLDVRKHFNV